MAVVTTPAAARTDLTTPVAGPADTNDAFVRRAGVTLAVGALIWAGGLATVGAQPDTSLGVTISDLIAVPFQLGLFALVTAQLRTGATGLGRFARGMLKVEFVLLALATLWSVLHGAFPAFRDDAWLAALDLFWPLSMLGMFVIAIKLVIAGRWRGVARGWPLVAESWVVVSFPAFGILGPAVGNYVAAGHLLVGYLALGVIMALRPQLTRAEA